MSSPTKPTAAPAAIKYPATVVKKSLLVLMALKKLGFVWGATGSAKTSLVHQIGAETDSQVYLLNLSTMEPTDVGGFLHPVQFNGRTIIEWLMQDNSLPFVTPERPDQKCILLADEVDRCYQQTQNAFTNLAYTRNINGRVLVPSCAIVCTGNGVADSGTTPITNAFASRGCHLYMQTIGVAAMEAWDIWAKTENVAPWMRGYMRYQHGLICGDDVAFPEIQRRNRRTAVEAWKTADFCDEIAWGNEVKEPLVYGFIGQEAGLSMLSFKRLFNDTPAPEAIAANADSVPVPKDLGVLCAVGLYLEDIANNDGKENVEFTKAFARYILRWPKEPRNDWFTRASSRLPSLVATQSFKKWEGDR